MGLISIRTDASRQRYDDLVNFSWRLANNSEMGMLKSLTSLNVVSCRTIISGKKPTFTEFKVGVSRNLSGLQNHYWGLNACDKRRDSKKITKNKGFNHACIHKEIAFPRIVGRTSFGDAARWAGRLRERWKRAKVRSKTLPHFQANRWEEIVLSSITYSHSTTLSFNRTTCSLLGRIRRCASSFILVELEVYYHLVFVKHI